MKHILCLFVLSISLCFSLNASDNVPTIENNSETLIVLKVSSSDQPQTQEEVYEVTDYEGKQFRLYLNYDEETARIVELFGDTPNTYYCELVDLRAANAGYRLGYSDYQVRPNFVYEGGKTEFTIFVHLRDGWLYNDTKAAKAKNPNLRLKAIKIK